MRQAAPLATDKGPAVGRSAVRFLVSGGLNTALTWGLYLVLLRWLPYGVGYSIAFAAGIGLAYLLGRYYVFQRSGGRGGLLWVAGIYLVQYLLGLGLVRLWVQGWQAPAWCAPLFATALVLPLTFALQRWVFRDRGGRA